MDATHSSDALDTVVAGALVAGLHAGHLGRRASDNPHRGASGSLITACLAFHWAEGFGAGRAGKWLFPEPLWREWTYVTFLNVVDLRDEREP